MFFQRTDVDAAAYQYDARYQPQSTEDRENAPQHVQKKQNYRPTPLKGYFITVMIGLLIVAMGLVVWARQAMPDSDNTYKLEHKRWMAYKDDVVAMRTAPIPLPTDLSHSAAEELRRAAEDFDIFDRALTAPTPTAAAAAEATATEQIYRQQMKGVRAPSYIISEYTEVITIPGSVSRFTTSTPDSVYYSTFTSYSIVSGSARVVTSAYTSIMPTMTEIPVFISKSAVVEKVTEIVVETSYSLLQIPGTWNVTGTDVPMSSVPYEVTKTQTREITRAGTVGSAMSTVSTDYTETGVATLTHVGGVQSYGDEQTVAYSTNYKAITGEVTAEPSTYVKIGKITITSYYTEPALNPNKNDKDKPPKEQDAPKDGDKDVLKDQDKPKDGDKNQDKPPNQDNPKDQDKPKEEPKPTPKVIDVVSVKQDETIKEVKQLGPVTVVKSVNDVEQVVATQAPVTIVRPVQNAVETTENVVITGADGVAVTKQVVSTVQAGAYATTVAVVTIGPDGVVRTNQAVSTVVPGAYVTMQNVVTTGADGLLTTQQVVKTMQAGSYVTTVNIVTTGADGLPTTQQIVKTLQAGAYETTIAVVRTGTDGLLTMKNVVSTVEPEEFVTTIDVVTTGTDGLPTSKKVATTMRGLLETIISTPGLTTHTSTKSARLTTITSTPSGSTTITSTRKGTTMTESTTIMETPEVTEDPQPKVHVSTKVIESTDGSYFLGKFLPAILSVLLSIPLRIIDTNAQLYQPFYALNRQHGATGKNSMTLHFSGFKGFLKPFSILYEGQPVSFITMLVVICSALMTPLATEAIGLKLHGVCKQDNADGCAIALGISPTPAHALLALLAFTIVLLCALLFFLRNWDTGLHANPWSIVGMASLAMNQQARPRKSTEKKIEREMADEKYGFGYFQNTYGEIEYGIVLYDDAGQTLHQPDGNTSSETNSMEVVPQKKKRANPFIALGWAWRLTFIAFLMGLVVLVLYYHLMPQRDTDFKRFINGSTFGVRFFFATMGVILSFGWTALFISVATIGPYQAMSKDPQLASDSIVITRPTNGFTGLWASIKHKQLYPGIVALMTILSEFMPILLTNVPYGLTQTRNTHQIAARASLAIMLLMLLTMIGSFFVKWPHMPVDPRSIAGAMYYVTESNMLNHFHGLAGVDRKERERRVKEIGGRYWFGQIVAKNGDTRTVVDRDDGILGIDNYVASRNLQQQHEYDDYEQYQPPQPQQAVPPQHLQMQQTQQYRRDSQQAYLPVSPQDVDTSYHGYQP